VQRFKMQLTMLSPVHVGSGQVLSPAEYLVREEPDGVIWFYAIDSRRMFGEMSSRQRAEFDSAVRSAGPAGVRRFLAAHFDPSQHCLWQCQADEGLLRACQPSEKREANIPEAPSIWTMTRTGKRHEPYLPGSSIKGAIRTAWLWWQSGRDDRRPSLDALAEQQQAPLFEAEVLGYRVQLGTGTKTIDTTDWRADPLRAVKVGDAVLCPDSNVIEQIVMLPAEAGQRRASGESIFSDATFSGLEGEEGEQIFATGQLAIDDRLQGRSVPEGLGAQGSRRWRWPKAVAGEISKEALLEACREFYLENLRREVERFCKPNRYLRAIGQRLLDLAGHLEDNETLLRIGRFSHFENMTVRPYAVGGSRRRALAGALRPMGWVKMRLDAV